MLKVTNQLMMLKNYYKNKHTLVFVHINIFQTPFD